MIRLTITREKLTDGSYVFNGDMYAMDISSTVKSVRLPEQINFVTERDAKQFADGWLNLHLHRTNTPAEVKYDY